MIEVSENLYRGPRPQDLNVLKESGFDCIISLQSGFYELIYNDRRESQFPCEYGLAFYNVGLSDFTPPKIEQVKLILSKIKKHQKVYIHCKHGVDRTGVVVACYRVAEQGFAPVTALREMFERGFHKFPYLLWVPSVRKLLKEFEK